MGMVTWFVYVTSPWDVSYSLGFSVIALVLMIIAGLLLIPDVDEEHSYKFCTDCFNHHSDGRSKSRSVSPDFHSDRFRYRNDRSAAVTAQSEYNQTPRPMMTPVENAGNGGKSYRPATFNNISATTLQRDRVGF